MAHVYASRYRGKDLGVWSSVSDVDKFCNNHNSANGYEGLCLGDYVTIMDGTYNTQWMIAGFDTEANNDSGNGVGICMIPKGVLGTYPINPEKVPIRLTYHSMSGASNETGRFPARGYGNSAMDTYLNSTVANALKTVLGAHIVNRTIRLSYLNPNVIEDDQDKYTIPYVYVSFKSPNMITKNNYLTLMTYYQTTGAFASSYSTKDIAITIVPCLRNTINPDIYSSIGKFQKSNSYYKAIYDRIDFNSARNVYKYWGNTFTTFSTYYNDDYYYMYNSERGRYDVTPGDLHAGWIQCMWNHNTKLPLFNHISPNIGIPYWVRDMDISTSFLGHKSIHDFSGWLDTTISYYDVNFYYYDSTSYKHDLTTDPYNRFYINYPNFTELEVLGKMVNTTSLGVRPFMYIR